VIWKGVCLPFQFEWVLGLCDPSTTAYFEFNSSVLVTSPLIHEIIQQRIYFSATVLSDQHQAKADFVSSRHQQQASRVSKLIPLLPDNLCCVVSEKGTSSWLSVLPIEEHGFALHKGAFRDALCLQYGWLPSGLPVKCVCGHGFTVNHAMDCSSGGFPILCHNELRDFTIAALKFVMMWLLSQFCSPYLGNLFIMPQPMWRMRHIWMLVYKDLGEVIIRKLSLM